MQKTPSLQLIVCFASVIICEVVMLNSSGDAEVARPELTVAHTLVANLGAEHIGKMIHMRTPMGNILVAWGDRILTGPLSGTTQFTEVVPRREGYAYSNGGCSLDIDGDGSDELVVARNVGNSGAKPSRDRGGPLTPAPLLVRDSRQAD